MKNINPPRNLLFINLFFVFTFVTINAQVGIGNTSPNSDALLEIGNATTTTAGLLLPRVNLTGTANTNPLSAHIEGMVVFNKATTGDVTPGFYYNDGAKWVRLGSASSDDWRITGNTGTSAITNFIGTIDDVDFMFRRNNIEAGQIGVTNTSLGVNTLLNNAGTSNIAFGTDALKTNSSGVENVAIGTNALTANTTAKWNTAVGFNALAANIDNADNTAMGAYALSKNTTGGLDNAAFGAHALENNTTGLGNAAFGEHALYNNIDGSSNTAVGENSLEENTSGIGNVVIGEDAGTRNTTGSGNVVIGQEALFSFPLGVSTGDNNVIIGRYAAQSNTSGRLNVIIGKDAMLSSTTSNFNVIMGVGAGSDPDSRPDAAPITTGSQNTLIGYKTQVNSSSASNATAIGFRALANCSDCLILGGVSGTNSGTSVNVGVGNNSPQDKLHLTENNAALRLEDDTGSYTRIRVNNTQLLIDVDPNNSIASTDITFRMDGSEVARFLRGGNFGIGTTNPAYLLDVDGDINTTGDFRKNGTIIPDYVFETYFDKNNSFNPEYKFESLKTIETFIKENNHLPNMQNREDIAKNGWNVSENVRVNLEKIEELFLHSIELDKKVTKLQQDKDFLLELIEIQKIQLAKQDKVLNEILKKLENK